MSTPLVIPLPSDTPLFTMRVPLDGLDYIFRVDYSGREDRWYLSIADATGAPIVSGLKLVSNWPLLARVADVRRPKGELMAYDSLDTGPPGLNDLGTGRRVKLMYFPLDVAPPGEGVPVVPV